MHSTARGEANGQVETEDIKSTSEQKFKIYSFLILKSMYWL